MKTNKRTVITIVSLAVGQILISSIFGALYPDIPVGTFRAVLIGISAFLLLVIANAIKPEPVPVILGTLSIFSSAFFGDLLVRAGTLTEKSFTSCITYLIVLVVTYLVLEHGAKNLRKK